MARKWSQNICLFLMLVQCLVVVHPRTIAGQAAGTEVAKRSGSGSVLTASPETVGLSSERLARLGSTIPHDATCHWGAAKVILRPASPGTGVIAGGAMRPVLEAAGIKDVLAKSLGSDNPINIARATLECLKRLRRASQVASLRGRKPSEVAPPWQLAETGSEASDEHTS